MPRTGRRARRRDGFNVKGKMRRRHPSLWVSELPNEGQVARNDHPVIDPEFYALHPSRVQTEATDDGCDADEAAAEGTQPFR